MLKTLLQEVYHLWRFNRAIHSTNLGAARRHLGKYNFASDANEAHCKTVLADAESEMDSQGQLIVDMKANINQSK